MGDFQNANTEIPTGNVRISDLKKYPVFSLDTRPLWVFNNAGKRNRHSVPAGGGFMAIETMHLLDVTFARDDLDKMLDYVSRTDDVTLIKADMMNNDVKGVSIPAQDTRLSALKDKLLETAERLHLTLDTSLNPDKSLDLEAAEATLGEINAKIDELQNIREDIIHDRDENQDVIDFLKNADELDINLEEAMDGTFVVTKFGSIRKEALDNMSYYLDKPFLYRIISDKGDTVHLMYTVTKDNAAEVDNVFKALNFEEFQIPDIVHGTNSDALKELKNEERLMNEYAMTADAKLKVLCDESAVALTKMNSTLEALLKKEACKDYVLDMSGRCSVHAFVTEGNLDKVRSDLSKIDSAVVSVLPADLYNEGGVEAPVVLVNNPNWVIPFQSISKVTRSDVKDTTVLYAALCLFIACVFFGDLTFGAVLTLIGLFHYLKSKELNVWLELGLAGLLGGLLYGTAGYVTQVYHFIPMPAHAWWRVIDGVILLVLGLFTLNTLKTLMNTGRLSEKLLSLKGLMGLIIVYAIAAYVCSVYEFHLHVAILPVLLLALVGTLAHIFVTKK